MNTTPLNSKPVGNGRKWTRASIAAAVAAGSITTEAANLLYSQLAQSHESEPTLESTPELTPDQVPEAVPDPTPHSSSTPNSNPAHNPSPNPVAEPVPEPVPEPELITEPQPNPVIEPEPIPEPTPASTAEPLDPDDDIVDVIVEEIDPQDIDTEDILLVDEIGTVYTVDGGELNAALIHDNQGNQAVMIDVDGDNVYDVIATPEGEVIAQVPGDIDESDVELLYAQQHGHTGYISPNDFDVAMNEEHGDIQDDISLT
jgi:hypothetical protein